LARRWVVRLLAATAALLLAAGVVPLAADRAIDRVSVELPGPDPAGETWLLVGSDSRAAADSAEDRARFGDTAQVPGARADVLVLVRFGAEGASVVSVPRDLVALTPLGIRRLASLWSRGPQALVDAVCSTLGVAVAHLVALEFDGFRDLVDAVGGIDVTVAAPIRDPLAGLSLPRTGRVRLDGQDTLAWVRARRAEILVDGAWVPEPAGAQRRADRARLVLGAIGARVSPAHPIRAMRAALAAGPALAADRSTHLLEIGELARRLRGAHRSVTLPVDVTAGRVVSVATLGPGAVAVLRSVGGGRCPADVG
jgi:LCP family protein required for cell wall assembly